MKITFYVSSSGRSYFERFLDEIPRQDKSQILAVFEDIKNYGLNALGCQFRPIEGKLWEIKIRTSGGGWRFFYVMLSSDHMHVLHSYRKQTEKAPKHELNVARKRLKEILR